MMAVRGKICPVNWKNITPESKSQIYKWSQATSLIDRLLLWCQNAIGRPSQEHYYLVSFNYLFIFLLYWNLIYTIYIMLHWFTYSEIKYKIIVTSVKHLHKVKKKRQGFSESTSESISVLQFTLLYKCIEQVMWFFDSVGTSTVEAESHRDI